MLNRITRMARTLLHSSKFCSSLYRSSDVRLPFIESTFHGMKHQNAGNFDRPQKAENQLQHYSGEEFEIMYSFSDIAVIDKHLYQHPKFRGETFGNRLLILEKLQSFIPATSQKTTSCLPACPFPRFDENKMPSKWQNQ